MMKRKLKIIRKGVAILTSFAMLIPAVNNLAGTAGVAKAADYGISNPRIAEDGTVTWDKIQFGSYKQSVEFEKQPVKWRILSVSEDGTDAFIMADKALDCKPYNNTYTDVTWETCTLRSWLNNEFYNEAFSAEEQTAIREVTVTNEDNPSYNTEGGNPTNDKVYLLSIDEASNKAYGFNSEFTNESKTRYVKATEYAAMNGADRSNSSDHVGNCDWWLRSLGDDRLIAASVNFNGAGDYDGAYFKYARGAVCPALHINLSSVYVDDAGEVDSDGKVTTSNNGYKNPRTSEGITTWDCVYFGNYKQDNVSKKEPVEWKVLSVNGDDAFIMADKALDCKPYNNTYSGMTWETCTLRNWLNNEFYNEAFNAKEQAAIREVTVTYNTEGGNQTNDKVYLLSIDEASNKAYGFDSSFSSNSRTRCVKATEYTVMNGAYRNNCYWWLRSPGSNSGSAAYVNYDGAGDSNGNYYVRYAVCPALHINLSSDTWKSAGTVSSNSGNDDPAATPTAKPSESPTSEQTGESTAIPTGTPVSDTTTEPKTTSTPMPTSEPTVTPSSAPNVTVTSTSAPTTQNVSSVAQSPTPAVTASATSQPEKTTVKKQIKLTSVKTKAKSKKITGKINIKGVTIKIKIGKKSYKKIIKSNKFTVNLSKKLKSKDKVKIVASKKNYTSFKKTYTVK